MTYQGAKNSTRIISWFPILLSKSSSVNSSTSLAWVHPAKNAKTNNLNISVDGERLYGGKRRANEIRVASIGEIKAEGALRKDPM